MQTTDYAAKARELADEAHRVLWQADNARAPHLIALAQVFADLAKTTTPGLPDGTIVAYPNQSGAVVAVTQTGPVGATTYPWNCTACTAGAHVGFTLLGYSQTAAEEHAAQCNALPIPA